MLKTAHPARLFVVCGMEKGQVWPAALLALLLQG